MVRKNGRSSVFVHTAAAFFIAVNGESCGDILPGSSLGHRRKGSFAMKRRILAFLLALVMVVGMVPTSVFADMAEGTPEEVTSVTEETEAPEEATEETEEVPSEPEETEETEEPEETEQTEETTVPEEEPEVYEGVVGEQVALEEAAPDAHVTFTVSVQGVLGKTSDGEAAIELPVTVKDLNSDGILTYDEALVALHDGYCPDGYVRSGYTVTKVWGVADTFYKYWKNGEYLTKRVDFSTSTVAEGDKLYTAVVKDTEYTSDVLASFDRTEVTVDAGESFTLKLTGTKNDNFSGGNVAGVAVGTWDNGTFTALKDTKTDTVGKVTLSFDKADTYIVSASGTVAGEYYDADFEDTEDIECPITAPYCVVTVNEAEKPAVTANVTFTISNQGVLAQTPDGKDAINLPVTVEDLDGNGVLTFDEANVALHKDYCPGGYTCEDNFVTNFWDTLTSYKAGSYLFMTNDVPIPTGVAIDTVQSGDKLYVAILKDQTTWSDALTFFDQKALTVDAYQEFTLNLQGGTTMGKGGYAQGAIAGAQVGTWKDGKFTALDGIKTDDKGNVTLKFAEGGTYIVSANGTVKADIANWGGGDGESIITVDAPITAPYCIVTVNEAEAPVTTVTVNFKMQDDEGGQFITAFGEKVSSDLAESYGYKDQVKNGVSALDVLVRAHEMTFDGAFDKDSIRDFLDVNDQGFITVFGNMETMAVAIIVNGQLPGNGSYTVNQAKVEDNDTVFFGMYSDTSSYSDRYAWLETADGKRLTGQTLYAGATVDLVVKGMSAMNGGEGTPAAGLKLGYVNMTTGEVSDLKANNLEVTSDGNGKLSYTIPEGMANRTVCFTVSGDGIMGELSVFKVGDVAKETDLVDIQLAIGGRLESSIQPLTLSPGFEHTTKNYKVDALDYIEEDSRYLWVKVEAIPYCTASFDFHGVTKDFQESELRQWRRLDKLTPGVENVLTLTSAAEGGITQTYTVTVPMEGDLNDQSIVWKTDLTEDTAVALGGEKTLTVEAALEKETLKPKEITYQWYSNTTASTEGGKAIEGATGASFKVPTDAKGITYYYAVASCGSLTATSGVVSVWVATVPKSITLKADYPYTIPNTQSYGSLPLGGVTYIVEKGTKFHIVALDENGDETPVTWKNGGSYGGKFDAATGEYTVSSTSYTYLTATSALDSSVTSKEKSIQVQYYQISASDKNRSVSLPVDGQKNPTVEITGGVNKYTEWTAQIPQGVAEVTTDLTQKGDRITLKALRPGTVNLSFVLDLGGEGDEKLTDSAVVTVKGVAVEDAEGNPAKTYLEITGAAPNPTAQLKAYVNEGRKIVSWTSENEEIATVDGSGVVTAHGVGTVLITAEDDQGTKGGIKVVVSDDGNPTFEALELKTGFYGVVSNITYDPAVREYTGVELKYYGSKDLTFTANTLFNSEKLDAVASYTDADGRQTSVSMKSGEETVLPNLGFDKTLVTLTLTDKTDGTKQSVYTLEVTRPRDASKQIASSGGLALMNAKGGALAPDLYKDKAEGWLFRADEAGVQQNSSYTVSYTYYNYRAYLVSGRPDFTVSIKGLTAYVHIRYSVDGGNTWKELPQGGGLTDVITFPEAKEDAHAEVRVQFQLVNDKAYAAAGNTYPELVADGEKLLVKSETGTVVREDGNYEQVGSTYNVWVEQIPDVGTPEILTAESDLGDWYPAFTPDATTYNLSIPSNGDLPTVTFTVSEGAAVKLGTNTAMTPGEDGSYTLKLTTSAQTVTVSTADGSLVRKYSFSASKRIAGGADKIVDYLCINSQYTNSGTYGLGPEAMLKGTLKSLGNFGGYATFYFEDGLTNDPANKYGVDFYVYGNPNPGQSFFEPGQVWVSEDGNTWYALAGSEHYDSAIWDYSVTYTKNGTGTDWSDNYGHTQADHGKSFSWPLASNYPLSKELESDSFTLSGILIPSVAGMVGNNTTSSFATGTTFGYADVLVNGMENPYSKNDDYSVKSAGFDLAWAVDSDGIPVDVSGKEFHYVKVVTATNIMAGVFGEKSTEVGRVFRADSTGSDVGTTAVPAVITFTENGASYSLNLEEGKQVYELTLPMSAVSIQVCGNADNTYVNNQWVASGEASKPIAISAEKATLVRIIVQTGDEEPTILMLKLTGRAVTEGDKPVITRQPQSADYVVGQAMEALTVEAQVPSGYGKLSYQWFENTESSIENATAIAGATESTYVLGTAEQASSKYYFCVVTGDLGADYSVTSDIAAITVVTVEEHISQTLGGTGTSEDPYKIARAEDYVFVGEMVAAGYSFAGQYLTQTADVTLPEGWTPIGCLIDESVGHIGGGKNARFFSGHLDGGNNTLTVPEGGLPLFAYVTDAYVQNLKIYGTRIEGYGLVNNLEGVGLKGNAITIDGVTLLSGTKTLKSGLIGTYITKANAFAGCSGGYLVTIRNCVAEEGVVIGYDGTESNIGTFAGRVNGTIENCESYATVQGVDSVGGIVGVLDNAKTTVNLNITGCTFGGTVEASGELAGGILGSGYIGSFAENAMRPNIEDCVVTGSITGSNMVGGIQGGDKSVAQTFASTPNHITGNTFSGVVTATDGDAVGSIVGYYRSLNKYDTITGNVNTSKGALRPIGRVEYVDTSAAEHETEFGQTYIDTSSSNLPPFPGWGGWQKNSNRTDDPLGADAQILCASSGAPKADEANVRTLLSGKSTTLKVLDPETGKALGKNDITWTLKDPQDVIYATVSATGAVKAKTVLTQVKVTFAGTLKGSYYGTVYQTVTILPKTTQVEILKDGENVTGKTLSLNTTTGERLTLKAAIYPYDTGAQVTWKSSNAKIAQVVDGTVSFGGKTGTVTITATTNDGTRVAASVKLQVGVLTESVKIDTPAAETLRSGSSLTLKATVTPGNPTVSGVTFKLVNASDSAYVTLSAAGKVTAKTVNEPHKVLIYAVSKDAAAVESDPITLTVLPKSNETLILKSGSTYVTNGKLVSNAEKELTLAAYTLSADDGYDEREAQNVVWTSSNAKVASVENGKVTCHKAGTAKITAAVGKAKVSVTVQVTTLAESINIETKNGNDFVVASGKSLALKATVSPSTAKQKAVTWSIADGSSYAKISASGSVTANKNLTAPVTVTVKAVAKDGSGAEAIKQITVYPIAQGVTISDVNHERTTGTLVWDMAAQDTAKFSAAVYPAKAQQSVTWKSSNAKIAEVDQNGNVTCHKAGTVTITASANDGSGKKAAFKLNVVKRMKTLTLADGTVEGGKSLQLKAVVGPEDTTNKKLTWKVSENAYGVKISASGKLTTKKVAEEVTVTVTASATDGSGKAASCTVTIIPKK